jgi:hypothetical protein
VKAVDYFKRHIYFNKSTPLFGAFDLSKYRMIQRPSESLDNPLIRRGTFFKTSGGMGTLFLQMVLTYKIDRSLGDIQVVAQSDDAAEIFTKTRAEEFILSQPQIARRIKSKQSTKSSSSSITNSLWLFTDKFVKITGPGESAQQSAQVTTLLTDESHMRKHFPPGTLTGFESRTATKWNRYDAHFTTAPDAGAEVDVYYKAGNQGEFCYRCLSCNNLVWPLWEDYSRDYYNGERVFHWTEHQSEVMTLESLRFICPHCDKGVFEDNDRTRFQLQIDGDYIDMNPGHAKDQASFRWSAFACYWNEWKTILSKWKTALDAERNGDFSKMEEFEKKILTMQYTAKLHALGDSKSGRDYKLGDVWITEENQRQFGSFDVQSKGGRHYWALCDNYTKRGDSRRVKYCRLENWTQLSAFKSDHGISDCDTSIDLGHEYTEVLAWCAANKWIGLQSGDSVDYFLHPTSQGTNAPNRHYGPDTLTDAHMGQAVPKEVLRARRRVRQVLVGGRSITVAPEGSGFGIVVQWSKPNVGFLMLALKGGTSDKYFGRAADMDQKCPDFSKQFDTYIEATKEVTVAGIPGFTLKRYLRQLSETDHAFPTACQNLVMAMRAGYFPMDLSIKKEDGSAA